MQNNNVTYFDSFGVGKIPKEIKALLTINIFKIQPHDSVMCGYFVLDLLILSLKGKR